MTDPILSREAKLLSLWFAAEPWHRDVVAAQICGQMIAKSASRSIKRAGTPTPSMEGKPS